MPDRLHDLHDLERTSKCTDLAAVSTKVVLRSTISILPLPSSCQSTFWRVDATISIIDGNIIAALPLVEIRKSCLLLYLCLQRGKDDGVYVYFLVVPLP